METLYLAIKELFSLPSSILSTIVPIAEFFFNNSRGKIPCYAIRSVTKIDKKNLLPELSGVRITCPTRRFF